MGTYTPAWNAKFGKPLVNQVIAIVQRDQAAALAIVNAARAAAGNAALVPISDFHKGPVLETAYPCLFVRWNGEAFDEEEAAYLRHQTARVLLYLEMGDADPQMAMENAADYAALLDIIITTATTSDWEKPLPIAHESVPSNLTVPNATGTVKKCFVESHTPVWTDRGGENETPTLAVQVPILFELEET
jgi:hypothetical protein